ncbi:MAG TPA: hypothetical protein VIV11_27545 [Kofleriaceae bacterium]
MRLALAALLLTGCIIEPPDSGPDYPPPGGDSGWGSGWGGGGGTGGYGCQSDAACGTGNVCARNGECTIASNVRIVRTTWTMRDQEASDTTCASAKQLDITFHTSGAGLDDQFGFSPVPCSAGKFTVDKLPLRYTMVSLARRSDGYGGATGTFDAAGNAILDLPY